MGIFHLLQRLPGFLPLSCYFTRVPGIWQEGGRERHGGSLPCEGQDFPFFFLSLLQSFSKNKEEIEGKATSADGLPCRTTIRWT